MASPAFIYAFDQMGDEEFTKLCGLLFGKRFRGFMLGSIGKDGGEDASIDSTLAYPVGEDSFLGIWEPDSPAPLLNLSDVYQKSEVVVFQFKYTVVGRVGQEKSRSILFSKFKCKPKEVCQLHTDFIKRKKPSKYVLVTNLEIGPLQREKFIQLCKEHNPEIGGYQIIGLDDLEWMITAEPELRSIFFPTIFGPPRFNLKITISRDIKDDGPYLFVKVSNIGTIQSFIESIHFEVVADNKAKNFFLGINGLHGQGLVLIDGYAPLDVGRSHKIPYNTQNIKDQMNKEQISNLFLTAVVVTDAIGNTYRSAISVEDNVFLTL